MVSSVWSVILGAALLCASLASAGPTASQVRREDALRLVKISESDPGSWMTEADKFERLTSKRIGFMDITDTMALEETSSARRRQSTSAFPSGPSHQAEAAPLIAKLSQSKMEGWTAEMTAFQNRYYLGPYAKPSAEWMFNTVKGVAAANTLIAVKQFVHAKYDQPSVIATIPGTSGKIVVVGAHYDSIAPDMPEGRAPGADDNASGIVTILDALRVLADAKYKPTNTLEFHFYSGEEGGDVGSRELWLSYKNSNANVVAMMNQDMTGYSPKGVLTVVTDFVDTGLTNFITTLVPAYTNLPLATDKCGYGCSDHNSARVAGYAAAYVTDAKMADATPHMHQATDTIDTVNFAQVLEHAKLTVGFLVEGSYF